MAENQNTLFQDIPLFGEMPDAGRDDFVLYIGCDNVYFRQHGIQLAFSVLRFAPETKVHFHVFNPDNDFDWVLSILMVGLRDLSWTLTFDHPVLPEDPEYQRIYYANARFTRLRDICHYVPANYFSLDTDSLVRGPLEGLRTAKGSYDIMLRKRDRDDPRKKVLAGGILLLETDKAREFIALVAGEIEFLFQRSDQFWTMDQVILAHVLEAMEGDASPLRVGDLPPSYLDWDFGEQSPIWTGKGDKKHSDNRYRTLYDSLWHDTLVDNISQNFWQGGENKLGPKVLVLAPRIDSSFKRTPLVTPELRAKTKVSDVADLRRYWTEFSENIKQSLAQQGVNARLLVLDNWRISPDLINILNPDAVLIPHRQNFQLEGIEAECFYYMQMVTRWLFTLDPEGWGAGASVYPCKAYVEGNPEASTFDHYREKLIDRNTSKFSQPDQKSVEALRQEELIPEENYIFFPCQVPDDETLLYFSDVEELAVVQALTAWANKTGIHVVFKGHPMGEKKMAPLIAAGTGSHVRWSNANIHDLIENAVAVYTVNSGVGFEALLHDKPIVSFARVEYDVVSINGSIDELDEAWSAVQALDCHVMLAEYRRFMDWYCRLFALDLSLPSDAQNERFRQAAAGIIKVLPKTPVVSQSPDAGSEAGLIGAPGVDQPKKGKGQLDRNEAMFNAFKFLSKSETEGDYFEFGCFQGSSLIQAYYSAVSTPNFQRRFFAFDSFEGLPPLSSEDQLNDYKVFWEGQFDCSKGEVEQNVITGGVPAGTIEYIQGFYDVSLKQDDTLALLGSSKAALLHVDCDLYSSAKDVLDFMSDRIADGAILMFDDWFCYRGRPDRGVARAFYEWEKTVPITFTEYFKYTWSGIAFICNIDVEPEFIQERD